MFFQGELYKYKTNNIFPVIVAVIRLIYWQNGVRNDNLLRRRASLLGVKFPGTGVISIGFGVHVIS